ncbi:MAG: stage V sporulation protein S [Candidatus Bipolaricaulota bacterium]|nr:MAG: stage V sporulation protein S [Candidatus Bipolaricaulota bacterium]
MNPDPGPDRQILRVSSSSKPSASAGAIANGIRETGEAILQVIGPRAVNQAVKSIAIARGYVAASGLDLYFVPEFSNVHVGEEERTAVQFTVRPRHPLASPGTPSEAGASSDPLGDSLSS